MFPHQVSFLRRIRKPYQRKRIASQIGTPAFSLIHQLVSLFPAISLHHEQYARKVVIPVRHCLHTSLFAMNFMSRSSAKSAEYGNVKSDSEKVSNINNRHRDEVLPNGKFRFTKRHIIAITKSLGSAQVLAILKPI
jgi:hypothetical protein